MGQQRLLSVGRRSDFLSVNDLPGTFQLDFQWDKPCLPRRRVDKITGAIGAWGYFWIGSARIPTLNDKGQRCANDPMKDRAVVGPSFDKIKEVACSEWCISSIKLKSNSSSSRIQLHKGGPTKARNAGRFATILSGTMFLNATTHEYNC